MKTVLSVRAVGFCTVFAPYAWGVRWKDNELMNIPPRLVFSNTLGEEFVSIAFRAARAADPNAKLYINDYNTDGSGAKSTAMINLVRKLKAAGVPIDGIGIQAHLVAGGLSSSFATNMAQFAALGVDVAITELDIRTRTPASASALTQQANDYRTIVNACLSVPRCVGITVWDYTDVSSRGLSRISALEYD